MAQTPLLRFVSDLLYNQFYNKSATGRNKSATNLQQIEQLMDACDFQKKQNTRMIRDSNLCILQ